MDYLNKLILVLKLRRAFVAGATEGNFGLNRVDAEFLAIERYPLPEREEGKGELPEIVEAMRVPQEAPHKGEFTENIDEVPAF